MVNLAPGAIDYGALVGVSGNTQFGFFNGEASLWHGTAASRVSLHPIGAPPGSGSTVYGMYGNEQVGQYGVTVGHAAVWHGTAASFVDLHPAGAEMSIAYGSDGTHQSGIVSFGAEHAALWSGTAATMVDLNPPGGGSSGIYGMVPGQQVGFATVGPLGLLHASMWSGTAASWVDLNPPGADSELLATCGAAQAGVLNGRAAVWFGNAASVVDLHALLPPEYYFSIALSVHESQGIFYVGGWAERSGGPASEAFLWVGVPEPASFAALFCAATLVVRRRRPIQGLQTQA